MSFETTTRGNLWTHSNSPKGGRRETVKKGVYVIDHRNTGKFIMGSSNDVSKEVDKHLALLAKGKHPVKRLQNQFNEEIQRSDKAGTTLAVMQIIEFPTNSEKEIKRTLKEIRETNTAPYCLLE